MIIIFAIFLLGWLLIACCRAFYFSGETDREGVSAGSPAHKHSTSGGAQSDRLRAAVSPEDSSRACNADTRRAKKSKEYRAAVREKNVFYGRHLRRIDQAQGLVLGTIGSIVYASGPAHMG